MKGLDFASQRLNAVLRILHGFSRRTHLKNLLNIPDSIKVTLGIGQLRTGDVLFGGSLKQIGLK